MRTLLLCGLLLAGPAYAQLHPEGCWVSFFAGPHFKPPSAQLAGRSYVESFETEIPAAQKPALDHVGGEAFFSEVDSLVVGPQARLVGYEEPRFRGRELVIGPGRHVADLDAIGFHQRVRSFRIFCEG